MVPNSQEESIRKLPWKWSHSGPHYLMPPGEIRGTKLLEFFVKVSAEHNFIDLCVDYLQKTGIFISDQDKDALKWLKERYKELQEEISGIIRTLLQDFTDKERYAFGYLLGGVTKERVNWKLSMLERRIKECGSCRNKYIATRKDSHYCDKCRNKANVANSRARNPRVTPHKVYAPIHCKFDECRKLFTSKTKRARFCSDICRVRAGRKKVTSS
jgi:hypothetical protein